MKMHQDLPILNSSTKSAPNVDGEAALNKSTELKSDLIPLVQEGVLVAFSGGMDSAFLLWAAAQARNEAGGKVVALTTTSPSTPDRDKEDAKAFSQFLKVKHVWEESREMELPEYARNDRERCYHCKTELFRIAEDVISELRLQWVLYGYNASDHLDHRPGHRAAQEAGALTPLSKADLSKAEISYLMEKEGLPLASKPASPCLSSRIMTGIEITPHRLQDVEDFEGIIRNSGASTLRVRVCQDGSEAFFLRVEVPPDEMQAVLRCREELIQEGIRRGYRWVTLDLGGYRTGGGVS